MLPLLFQTINRRITNEIMGKKIKQIAGFALSFLIGVVGALAILSLPPLFGLSEGTLSLIVGFAFAGICFILHVFIHEFGHLIGGKMSGYEFVSIRFFNIAFIKKDGKLLVKKYNVAGTGGQCLMSPPEMKNGTYPFVLYLLSGSLLNFLASAISLAIFFIFLPQSSAFAIFAVVGILAGILNIVPMNLGIPNDGLMTLTLRKNESARYSLWLLSDIVAQFAKGMRPRDIPENKFDFLDNLSEKDKNNALVFNIEYYRFGWLIHRREFEKAKALAEHLLKAENILEIFKNEFTCELLFLELIGECRKEEIERLYTKDIKNYIKATSSYVSRQRLLYAYAKLFLQDDAQATKALEKFNKVSLSYPYDGEIEGNRELIEMVDKLAIEKKNFQ